MNNGKKLFIVRKYILAKTAAEAIKLDKIAPVDDVWVEDRWLNQTIGDLGFKKDGKQ